MKLVYFDVFRLGVLAGESVVDVTALVQDIPHTGPHDPVSGLIERFAQYRPRLEAAAKARAPARAASLPKRSGSSLRRKRCRWRGR